MTLYPSAIPLVGPEPGGDGAAAAPAGRPACSSRSWACRTRRPIARGFPVALRWGVSPPLGRSPMPAASPPPKKPRSSPALAWRSTAGAACRASPLNAPAAYARAARFKASCCARRALPARDAQARRPFTRSDTAPVHPRPRCWVRPQVMLRAVSAPSPWGHRFRHCHQRRAAPAGWGNIAPRHCHSRAAPHWRPHVPPEIPRP